MTDFICRIARFGLVGLTAAYVHYSVVVYLVQYWHYVPLVANVIAFFISFQVSYTGHRFWTFREAVSLHREALPRMFILQLTNLVANEGLFYILLLFDLPYKLALIFVLGILPIFTYLANRFWVFR